MPYHVVSAIGTALNNHKKSVKGAKVLILGVAYKKDVGDIRESPALDILELLLRRGAEMSYSDPFVPTLQHGEHLFEASEPPESPAEPLDCYVICTDHSSFDWNAIVKTGTPIVDTRNALHGFTASNIVRLSGRVGATPVPV